jgi:hypothetical protein
MRRGLAADGNSAILGVEPTPLEPVTPCLQSGGTAAVERRSCLASREDSHPPPPGCAFVAAVCCCRFATGASPVAFHPTRAGARPLRPDPVSDPDRECLRRRHLPVWPGEFLGRVWTWQHPELQRERQDRDCLCGDRQCRSHPRFSPCEVWLRYHPTQRRQGITPIHREIHIQLVNEMTRVKACARLLLPNRNAGRERGVSCRTPSARRNRDSS